MTNSTHPLTDAAMPIIISTVENNAESDRLRKLLEAEERRWLEMEGMALSDMGLGQHECVALAQQHLLQAALLLSTGKKFTLIPSLLAALKEIRL